MGRSIAPKGFYTAAQAIKKTGLPASTFHDMVKKKKITRIVPPNRTDGFYPKAEIDKMAKAHELFVLQYATDTSVFEKAEKEDLQGIVDLCVELFGKNGVETYEERLAQYNRNPEIFYVLKQDNLIVGYVGIIPLKQEAINKIMSGIEESRMRTEILTPENITVFRADEADQIFLVIGVQQGLAKSKTYASRVISGGIEAMEDFARRGIIIKKLYATSRTQTPISEEDDLLRFELDLATAEEPVFKKYQTIAKRVGAVTPKSLA